MFISKEEIKTTTGYDVDQQTLATAQIMIEAWVGRDEAEVEDASDAAILGRAVLFQAVYMNDSKSDLLEQAAIKQQTTADGGTTFDTAQFSPFMSPWAIKACEKVSWRGTRSVHTGAIFQNSNRVNRWEFE